MSEVMPIKIYKDKVEIASEANLTVCGTANIGNKIILGVAEDGNAALSIAAAANGITVGDNIIIGSDGNITANSFVGKSISDGNGNNIVETYATKEALSTEVGALSTNISSVNTALSNYKDEVSNTYALKTEIPSLSGYATETFVNTTLANYVPTSRTINSKALTGNITLGAEDITSGILKVANGGTGMSYLYENITITPNLGTLVSGSYARYYPHLKLVVVSAQLSGVTISTTGSSVSLLTLSNYGTGINIGVAAYTGVGGAVNNCYISGRTISLNVSKTLSSKNVGVSVAYLIG